MPCKERGHWLRKRCVAREGLCLPQHVVRKQTTPGCKASRRVQVHVACEARHVDHKTGAGWYSCVLQCGTMLGPLAKVQVQVQVQVQFVCFMLTQV
jgi:hypothetical protein